MQVKSDAAGSAVLSGFHFLSWASMRSPCLDAYRTSVTLVHLPPEGERKITLREQTLSNVNWEKVDKYSLYS